ncbi:MAG: D-alanyl-D-alanine carboxypeptidase family protein [Lysobacterales bacterium]|jgi:D-alanyl-D-alanine carboxypeptidase (penicillin-binding protein 5/6)
MPIMKKLLLLILIAVILPMAADAQRPPPPPKGMPTPAAPELAATGYILMDFHSGSVLVEHDADAPVEPASITKVMTSYVVFTELAEGNILLEDTVNVSEKAWRTGGSRTFIEPGMEVTIEQLLKGMIIQSGNDASVALAEHLAGTEEAFAGLMNHYAAQLGMANSNFTNATGLPDENHYTSARDVALLSAALIRDFPDLYAWYSEKEYSFNNIRQHNRNNLLWRDPAVDGLKTGHTQSAGYCLAASAKRDGMRLISVVLGSSSESSRVSESQSLLNYGFRFFETVQLYMAGQELAQGTVWKGEQEQVRLGIADELYITIPRGRYDELDAQVEMRPELIAPIEAGEEVGRISIRLEDEEYANRGLITLEAVDGAGFFGRTWDSLVLWFGGLFEDE